MSQPLDGITVPAKKGRVPKYLVISLLTLFSFGPQYFLNLSYILNQVIIQNGLQLSTHDLLLPSVTSNLAFALGVPLGRVLSGKYGIRKTYLTFILIFLAGSVIDLFSWNILSLTFGRIIQGFSAGILFLTILPVSLKAYPNKVRNLFLFFAIAGLFGSSAVGAFAGSVSLSIDSWRWLFILNILSSLFCFWIGYNVLPNQKPEQLDQYPIDRKGLLLLSLIVIALASPLTHLQQEGFGSLYVWPFLLAAFMLLVFFIYTDYRIEHPLVPIRSLWAAKPIFGMIMAVTSHVVLIIAIAGTNGILVNVINPPFAYLAYFYLWFFAGIVGSGIIATLLYDKTGPGILGIIGSLFVVFVGMEWKTIGADVSLHALYIQMACLGGGVSMVLISGALGTALAGDIHKATLRSAALHTVRNFIGAIGAPLLGWFLYRMNAIHYEHVRGQVNQLDPEVQREMAASVQHLVHSGLSLAEAKNSTALSIVVNARKTAVLHAYHDLFSMMVLLGIVMTVASVGKAVTGKGRSLVQKEMRQDVISTNIKTIKGEAKQMKRLIMFNIIGMIVLVGLVFGGVYYYYEAEHFVKTDDAKVAADMAQITAPASGKLTDWTLHEGSTIAQNAAVGKVTDSEQALSVTSLMKGTIIKNEAMNGQLVQAGEALAQTADMDHLYITANIKETDLQDVEKGDSVDITVDGDKETTFKGTIVEIGYAANSVFSVLPQSTSANYTKVTQKVPVKISLQNPSAKVLPGMNAEVKISL